MLQISFYAFVLFLRKYLNGYLHWGLFLFWFHIAWFQLFIAQNPETLLFLMAVVVTLVLQLEVSV